VAMVPAGVDVLVRNGHQVFVEKGAGDGSGFGDAAYLAAGAKVVNECREVFGSAEMIVKVKEPLEAEFP